MHGYFLLRRANVGWEPMVAHPTSSGDTFREEPMFKGRSKHLPGRLAPIINSGSSTPLQEAASLGFGQQYGFFLGGCLQKGGPRSAGFPT